MNQKSSLLMWAGILSLVSWFFVTMLLLAWIQMGFSLNVESIALIVEALLCVAGGVLALVGLRAAAPWLIIGAFAVGEVFSRIYTQLTSGWFEWPWYGLQYFSDNKEYWGSFAAIAFVLADFALVTLLAASVLALIAFFKKQPTTRAVVQVGVQAEVGVSNGVGGIAAGWYPDPSGLPSDRYWDGSTWSDQTRPQSPRPMSTPVTYASAGSVGAPSNGMGTAALVLGILGIIILPGILSILAIIFGSVGIARVNRGAATNKGAAVAGLVLGLVGLLLGIVAAAIIFGS